MGSGPKVTRLLSAGHLGGPTAANNNDDYKNYAEETDKRTDIRHYCPAFPQTKRLYCPLRATLGDILPLRIKNVNNIPFAMSSLEPNVILKK